MYVVFQSGRRQYRVVNGQVLYIDRVKVDIGGQIEFDKVLLVQSKDLYQIGCPFIEKIKIIATVLDHSMLKKIRIVKFRRRKHCRKIQGHRQCVTKIQITKIDDM